MSHNDEPGVPSSNTPSAPTDHVFGRIVSRVLSAGRREIGSMARASRARLETTRLERDLERFWIRLGKTAYHLAHAKELDHPALHKAIARIEELEAQIALLKGSSDRA